MNSLTDFLPVLTLVGIVGAVVLAVRSSKRQPHPVAQPAVPGQGAGAAPTAASAPASTGGAGMVFERLCWVVTMLAATVGAYRLFDLAMANSASAPQYAAEAAGVCAAVIVPYVFSRAVGAFRRA